METSIKKVRVRLTYVYNKAAYLDDAEAEYNKLHDLLDELDNAAEKLEGNIYCLDGEYYDRIIEDLPALIDDAKDAKKRVEEARTALDKYVECYGLTIYDLVAGNDDTWLTDDLEFETVDVVYDDDEDDFTGRYIAEDANGIAYLYADDEEALKEEFLARVYDACAGDGNDVYYRGWTRLGWYNAVGQRIVDDDDLVYAKTYFKLTYEGKVGIEELDAYNDVDNRIKFAEAFYNVWVNGGSQLNDNYEAKVEVLNYNLDTYQYVSVSEYLKHEDTYCLVCY